MRAIHPAKPAAALGFIFLIPLLARADVTFTLTTNVTAPPNYTYFCTNNDQTVFSYQVTGQFTVPGSFTDLAGLLQQVNNLPGTPTSSINGTGTVNGSFTDCGATISGPLSATISFTNFTDDGSVGVFMTWPDPNASLFDLCQAGGCPWGNSYDQIGFYDLVATSSTTVTSMTFVEGPSGTLTITSGSSGGGSTLTITTTSLNPAAVNVPYGPVQLQATGGTPPYTWTWTGNMLPAGMQLTSGGVLQGTPQRASNYQLPITVVDSSTPQQKAIATLSLTVNPAPVLQFTTAANLPQATVNTPYNQLLALSGATSAVTYQPTSDSTLPPGLSLAGGTESGVYLSGTPSEPGSFGFTIVAMEACTGCTATKTFNLNVGSSSGPLQIIYGGSAVTGGTVALGVIHPGTATQFVFTAQGGTPPYQWINNNPSLYGLSFTNCTGDSTCTLSGTPYGPAYPSSNQFFTPLTLKDSAQPQAEVPVTVVGEIYSAPSQPLSSSGPLNDTATQGLPYLNSGFPRGVNGGNPPYVCTPQGAQNLAQRTGVSLQQIGSACLLAGTPISSGDYPVSADVTDQNNAPPVSVPLNLDIQPQGTSNGAQAIHGRSIARALSAPSISPGGVVDIAAYQPILTPGGVMSIFGSNLADNVDQPSSTPLPTSFDNIQVSINGENAALFYVSPDQINFQAPVDPFAYYPLTTPCLQNPIDPATFMPVNCPPPGAAQVTVIKDGIPSLPVTVPVSTSMSAVLTNASYFAVATHANNQLITQSAPAQAGEAIVLYGSGIGYPMCSVSTGVPSGTGCLANVVPQFTFPDYPGLNGSATLLYAGLTPGGVGLAQFNLQLPDSLPSAAGGSIRVRIGDPTTGETFSIYLPGSSQAIPAITSLSPASATAGGAQFTLTVDGSNFASGATVEWNGTALPTSFVTSNQLTATVGANLIANAGSASITVISQGQTSSPVSFSIAAAAACATYPAGFVPFSSVAYISAADSAGDMLVVGSVSAANLAAIQALPLPASTNQEFCGQVNLGGGYNVLAYVPTAAERSGDYSAFAGLLVNPANNAPFPAGIIPQALLGQVYAWRIPSQNLQGAGPASIAAVSGNNQTALSGQAFSAPLVVQVNDSTGNPLSGVLVTWTVSQGTATLSNTSTSTNSAGQASTTVTAGASAGTVNITAAAGLLTAQFTLAVNANTGNSSAGYQLLTFPTTNNIQTGLINAFPTGIFTANNFLGTPFSISAAGGNCGPAGEAPCNFYDGFGSLGNGLSIEINVSIDGPTDIYTLMNAYSPPAGVQVATIQFLGSGGASASFPLIGGENIRDYYQGAFANTLNNGVPDAEAMNAFACTDPGNCLGSGGTGNVQTGFTGNYVIDEQHFSLGTAFVGQTLTQIIITDTNNGSNPILIGLTAQSAGAAPTITTLSPPSVTVGGSAFTLTVYGYNFAFGATVLWNGTPLPTTYVNATQLTASVAASFIASSSSPSISVSSGGQTSAPVTLTIISYTYFDQAL